MRAKDFRKLVRYFKKCKAKVAWTPGAYAFQEWDDKETEITFNLPLAVAETILHEYFHRHCPKFKKDDAEEKWVNAQCLKYGFTGKQAHALFTMALRRFRKSHKEE